MKGTRWKQLIDDSVRSVYRELRVTFVRVPEPKKWVFIVGCYQSGKTVLHRLLEKHRSIGYLPSEGQFLTDQLIRPRDFGLPRMWTLRENVFRMTEEDTGPDVTRIKKQWAIHFDLKKPVLLEESPPNMARTRWLQANFENAYFIGVVRNGYAVVEAIHRKTSPKHLERWSLEQCIKQWVRSNEILIEDSDFLENLLWVKYEDLTGNLSVEIKRVIDFLQLDEDDFIFDPGQRLVVHDRNEKVVNLNYENFDKLSKADLLTIGELAGPMLRRFGYEVLKG